jgi:pilus assembly protein CpaF
MNPEGPSRLTSQDLIRLKKYLADGLVRALEMEGIPAAQRPAFVQKNIAQVYEQTKLKIPEDLKKQIFDQVMNDILGYGPIQILLDDPDVTEIMVNGPKKIFVEKKGQLTRANVSFDDDDHVIRIIERIILPLGRRVDADSPTVDARLPDGSRVNAVVRPVAIDGPSITIRKFRKDKLKVEDLVNYGSMSQAMADFLQACVKARFNIVISGGTGSGKTTLLNVMSGFIPEDERIITIEDAAELQLQQDHVMRMETKTANADGLGAVSIRELVKNSLRMRPDRSVVGPGTHGRARPAVESGSPADFICHRPDRSTNTPQGRPTQDHSHYRGCRNGGRSGGVDGCL